MVVGVKMMGCCGGWLCFVMAVKPFEASPRRSLGPYYQWSRPPNERDMAIGCRRQKQTVTARWALFESLAMSLPTATTSTSTPQLLL